MTGLAESWLGALESRLSGRQPEPAAPGPDGGPLHPAAVLVPLFVRDRQLFTIFTERTELVEHHKGQISFPGGVHREGETLEATALREAEEEVGIPAARVRVLGSLPSHVTVTRFEVHAFVGAIPYPIAFTPAPSEVKTILEIPIPYLLAPEVVEERNVAWQGQNIPTLVYHYRGHAIWGATARILADLLEVLRGDWGPSE